MIEVDQLSKSYGSFEAVRRVSFRVEKGEIVGFLGPNGAGKSTTLRIIAGFLGATSGRVRIAGYDINDDAMAAREKLGYMPETSPLYPEMRVREYLAFRAELKRIARRSRKDAVEKAIHDARVADVAAVLIGHLSKGYRQRVGLADALLGSPPLLVLDEPTAGLDPNQIREVRALIRALGQEHTVLLSTHILSEVEATCSRALVIARGELVAEGSIEAIRAMRRPPGVKIVARGDRAAALSAARSVPGVGRVKASEGALRGEGTCALAIELAKDEDGASVTEAVVGALVAAGLGVREVTAAAASLEQVFSELTAEAHSGAPPPGDEGEAPAVEADE